MPSRSRARVLLFGTARSGTSWAAEVLGATADATLVAEPDHVNAGLTAVKGLRGRGRTTVLGPDDVPPRGFVWLWRPVLSDEPVRRVPGLTRVAQRLGAPYSTGELRAVWDREATPVPGRLRAALALTQPPSVSGDGAIVVKTVVSVLAVEWLLARWEPQGVWIRRHPLDVVAGRRALAMTIDLERIDRALDETGHRPAWCPRPPAQGEIARQAWYVGLTMSWCRAVVTARPQTIAVAHEDLCRDPIGRFRALAGRLGLEWTDDAERVVRESDGPGEGWATRRVASVQPGKWRTRLDAAEQREAIECLRRFPIAEDYSELR